MKKAKTHHSLPVEALKWHCDHKTLKIKSTDEIKLGSDIIGQKRAVNALRLGFDIESQGYNIFVTGMAGTGRRTAIKCLLKQTERIKRLPDDKLYVNNFKNPDMPKLIRLPAGKGRRFRKDMEEFIDFLSANIPGIFESDEYQNKKKKLLENMKGKEKKLVLAFEQEIAKENFALIQMQVGFVTRPAILPLYQKNPVNFDQLNALASEGKISKEELANIDKKHTELSEKMEIIFKEIKNLEKITKDELKNLDSEFVTPLVEHRINDMKEHYKCKAVMEYFDEIKENILENLNLFLKGGEKSDISSPIPFTPEIPRDPFIDYRVNLLVDNCGAKEAPAIFETSPSYANIFGTVEITPHQSGYSKTDFTKIKAGSILKADGGFLIIEALDLLLEPGVWPTLKRALKNRKLEIQIFTPIYMITISAMKPEPIEIDVKVAIIGDPYIYQLLYHQDPDFKKIFKLRADFDSVMDINQATIMDYAHFIKKMVSWENLLPFNQKAIMEIIEYGVRLAGTQKKLSTQFHHIADILREANYWANLDHNKIVTEKHITKAIDERMERSRLIEEKIQEMIDEGIIMIDTQGSIIGQVNGLSVYDMGDYSFGRPSRITAIASVGSAGVINIEREAQMSGKIHNKGVLILSGYLRQMYAQEKPLAMSASICFEQSYSGVEGDSASSTELYALLSAISELPLRQDIAVTGSVNQWGDIQPIGGVNQKIEGFFEVCKQRGLTGTQGVIIPHQNMKDLMLNEKVINAVKQGQFHIYAVKNIDEGIEILTGVKAGAKTAKGFESGTVHHRVDQKLAHYAQVGKQFGKKK